MTNELRIYNQQKQPGFNFRIISAIILKMESINVWCKLFVLEGFQLNF